jgi:hypothetical protein
VKIGSSSKTSVRVDQLLAGLRISLIYLHRNIEDLELEVTNCTAATQL